MIIAPRCSNYTASLNRQSVTAALPVIILVGTIGAAIPSTSAFAQALSFGPPTQIVGTAAQDAEPPTIRRSGNNVYIVWHEFPPQDTQPDIYLSRSTDKGNTFSLRTDLSNTKDVDSSQEAIAVSGNNVFIVWIETDINNVSKLFFTRSKNGGASFSKPEPLSDVGNPTVPRIAASGENVYVAWQAAGQQGLQDIFFTQSSNAGKNFTDIPVNISENDGQSEFRDAGLNQLEVSGDKVVVTWRDNTPGDFEIFFAHSQ
jgi:hypothetical protein